jgi:hypothetical protein
MIINAIIVLLIVVLSIPLKKKSQKLLRDSYLEDDFAKQHKLVEDSIMYNKLFVIILLSSLLILLIPLII